MWARDRISGLRFSRPTEPEASAGGFVIHGLDPDGNLHIKSVTEDSAITAARARCPGRHFAPVALSGRRIHGAGQQHGRVGACPIVDGGNHRQGPRDFHAIARADTGSMGSDSIDPTFQ